MNTSHMRSKDKSLLSVTHRKQRQRLDIFKIPKLDSVKNCFFTNFPHCELLFQCLYRISNCQVYARSWCVAHCYERKLKECSKVKGYFFYRLTKVNFFYIRFFFVNIVKPVHLQKSFIIQTDDFDQKDLQISSFVFVKTVMDYLTLRIIDRQSLVLYKNK